MNAEKSNGRAENIATDENARIMALLICIQKMYRNCLSNTEEEGTRFTHFPLHVFFENGKRVERDQSELAEMIGITPAAITDTLKYLEKEGTIRRKSDPKDLRKKRIALTDEGLELMKRRRQASLDLSEKALADFSDEQKQEMQKNLLIICSHLALLEDGNGRQRYENWLRFWSPEEHDNLQKRKKDCQGNRQEQKE